MPDQSPDALSSSEDISWYCAVTVFAAEHEPRHLDTTLCERMVFLLRASNDDLAKARALELARAKEHSYSGAEGTVVTWSLRSVERVLRLDEKQIVEGTEVFSEFFDLCVKFS